MEFKKVTAIVRSDQLKCVEEHLKQAGIQGISVSEVKGYGEYADFFKRDWLVRHARIEIFAEKAEAERIVQLITEAACTGAAGDGIIAMLPVEKFLHIRTGTPKKSEGS